MTMQTFKFEITIDVGEDMCGDSEGQPTLHETKEWFLGPFSELASTLGTWRVTHGVAAIQSEHVRSGARSLHLTGGERCEVELDFEDLGGAGRVGFWAERWTRVAPFEFTLAVRVGGEWSALLDASDEVVIGSCNTSRQYNSSTKWIKYSNGSSPKPF